MNNSAKQGSISFFGLVATDQRKQWLEETAAMVSAYFPKKRR